MSDAWIAAKVMADLHESKEIDSHAITVTAKDGVIILTSDERIGDYMEDRAIELAKAIHGVKSVNDDGLKQE